mgnify:CR=1 FL=1
MFRLTDRGQRPARRARSARHGRGGRWPVAHGHRLRLVLALRMTSAMASVNACPGSVTRLTHDVEALLEQSAPPRCLLFDFRRVSWVDTSASQALASSGS